MNTARLRAFVNAHKTPLGIGGALVVAAAALYARKRSALAAAGTTTGTKNSSTSGATSAGTYSAYGQTVPYDSSATDVYNALQPLIEGLQQQARNIPVSTTPATSGAKSLGIFSDPRGAWYELYDNYSGRWVSRPEAVAKNLSPQATLTDAELAAFNHPLDSGTAAS